jgi:hypothetical protein
MKKDPEKIQRQRIRELAALAHERELAVELGALEEDFCRWRRGEITVHDLCDRIHGFHNGPARRLHSLYQGDLLDIVVGAAIGRGVLTEKEVPPELVDLLRRHVDFARETAAKNETSSELPLIKPLQQSPALRRPDR